MRSINESPKGFNKDQREIHSNRKVTNHTKTKLPVTQHRRKQKMHSRTRDTFSPGVEEEEEDDDYNIDDDLMLYNDMEEIAMESPEPEQRAFKSLGSTVRPLLQLFQDDSYPIEKSIPQSTKSPVAVSSLSPHKNQVVYTDIDLSSEEEDFQQSRSVSDDSDDVVQERLAQSISMNVGRFLWTPKSTNLFLDLWERNLRDIRGIRKNSHIYREMAEEMREYGASSREIKSKMDNMSRKYRLEEEKIKTGGTTNWRYFNRVKSLLTKSPSVHFEEILFDNTESTSFFQSDNSDSDIKPRKTPRVESISHGTENGKSDMEEGHVEENKQTAPTISRQSSRDKDNVDKSKRKSYRTDRMLQIEEEKLEIERQKLQVMKHISRDLSSISKTLIEVLRNTTK